MAQFRSRPLMSSRALHADARARDPLERLIESGLRLGALHDEAALHNELVAQAAALLGAQRVLLLQDADEGLQVLAARLPRGEKSADLLAAIEPWIAEARHSRRPSLRHGPDGTHHAKQRSCLIAPLLAERQLQGYLYADVEGGHGRFEIAQRKLLETLAHQGASALLRIRCADALQVRLAERDAELAQRSGELALVNSIQQGMAARLEFRAIIQLVGDKLRELFASGDVNIVWWDDKTDMVQAVYRYEHNVPLPLPPARQLRPDEPIGQILRTRQVGVLNTREEQTALGISPLPGTDWAHSIVAVPIIGAANVRSAPSGCKTTSANMPSARTRSGCCNRRGGHGPGAGKRPALRRNAAARARNQGGAGTPDRRRRGAAGHR